MNHSDKSTDSVKKFDSNESFATWNNLQQTTSSLFVTEILASENLKYKKVHQSQHTYCNLVLDCPSQDYFETSGQ